MKKKQNQINFLPWINFKEEYKIGPILFWPYYKMKDKKRIDNKIINHLDKYFKQFIDYERKEVKTITICTYNGKYFKILTDKENLLLKSSMNSLFFSTIIPQIITKIRSRNYQFAIPNSDIFNMLICNFYPGSNSLAVQFEGVLNGGWKIGELCFQKPVTTGYSYGEPNEELIGIFDKFMLNQSEIDSKRLFRCLEWFNYAHRSNSHTSSHAKILMMATAYEIFFNMHDSYNKRDILRKKINDLFLDEGIKTEVRKERNGKEIKLNLAGWWANDFYNLRNKIVHGDEVELKELKYKDKISYIDVADLLLWKSIILKSYDKCFIGKEKINSENKIMKILNALCPNNNTDQSIINRKVLNLKYDFESIYKAIGWI